MIVSSSVLFLDRAANHISNSIIFLYGIMQHIYIYIYIHICIHTHTRCFGSDCLTDYSRTHPVGSLFFKRFSPLTMGSSLSRCRPDARSWRHIFEINARLHVINDANRHSEEQLPEAGRATMDRGNDLQKLTATFTLPRRCPTLVLYSKLLVCRSLLYNV